MVRFDFQLMVASVWVWAFFSNKLLGIGMFCSLSVMGNMPEYLDRPQI